MSSTIQAQPRVQTSQNQGYGDLLQGGLLGAVIGTFLGGNTLLGGLAGVGYKLFQRDGMKGSMQDVLRSSGVSDGNFNLGEAASKLGRALFGDAQGARPEDLRPSAERGLETAKQAERGESGFKIPSWLKWGGLALGGYMLLDSLTHGVAGLTGMGIGGGFGMPGYGGYGMHPFM